MVESIQNVITIKLLVLSHVAITLQQSSLPGQLSEAPNSPITRLSGLDDCEYELVSLAECDPVSLTKTIKLKLNNHEFHSPGNGCKEEITKTEKCDPMFSVTSISTSNGLRPQDSNSNNLLQPPALYNKIAPSDESQDSYENLSNSNEKPSNSNEKQSNSNEKQSNSNEKQLNSNPIPSTSNENSASPYEKPPGQNELPPSSHKDSLPQRGNPLASHQNSFSFTKPLGNPSESRNTEFTPDENSSILPEGPSASSESLSTSEESLFTSDKYSLSPNEMTSSILPENSSIILENSSFNDTESYQESPTFRKIEKNQKTRAELERDLKILQERNQQLENQIRYINFQKSDCLIKCFWSEESRDLAKKYFETNKDDPVSALSGARCEDLFKKSGKELQDLKLQMDQIVSKIEEKHGSQNESVQSQELSRCQDDVIKLTKLYQASKNSDKFEAITKVVTDQNSDSLDPSSHQNMGEGTEERAEAEACRQSLALQVETTNKLRDENEELKRKIIKSNADFNEERKKLENIISEISIKSKIEVESSERRIENLESKLRKLKLLQTSQHEVYAAPENKLQEGETLTQTSELCDTQVLEKCNLDKKRLYDALMKVSKSEKNYQDSPVEMSEYPAQALKKEIESLQSQEIKVLDLFIANMTRIKSATMKERENYVKNLEHQIKVQSDYINATQIQARNYKTKLLELTSHLDQISASKDDLSKQLTLCTTDNVALTAKLDQSNENSEDLQSKLGNCLNLNEDLGVNVDLMTMDVTNLTAKLQYSQQKQREMSNMMDQCSNENLKMTSEVEKYTQINARMRSRLNECLSEHQEVEDIIVKFDLVANSTDPGYLMDDRNSNGTMNFRLDSLNNFLQQFQHYKQLSENHTELQDQYLTKINKQKEVLTDLQSKLSYVSGRIENAEKSQRDYQLEQEQQCRHKIQQQNTQVEILNKKNEKLRSALQNILNKSNIIETQIKNVHGSVQEKTKRDQIREEGVRIQIQMITDRLKVDMECNEKLQTCLDKTEGYRVQLRDVQLQQYQYTTKIYQSTRVLKNVSKFLTYLLTRLFRVHDGINDLKQISVNLRKNLVRVHSEMGHCTGSLQALKNECSGLVSWYQSLPNIEGLKRRLTDCENDTKYGAGNAGYLISQLKKQAQEFERLTKQEHICENRLRDSMTEMIELTRSVYLLSNNGDNANDTSSVEALKMIVENHEKLKNINQVLYDHLKNTTQFQESEVIKHWNMSSFVTTEQAIQLLFKIPPSKSVMIGNDFKMNRTKLEKERYHIFIDQIKSNLDELNNSKKILLEKFKSCNMNKPQYIEEKYVMPVPERVVMEENYSGQNEGYTTSAPAEDTEPTETTNVEMTTIIPSINIEKIKGLLNTSEIIQPSIRPDLAENKSDEIRERMNEIRGMLEKAKAQESGKI